MHLVDDDQPGPVRDHRRPPREELGVGESFRGDEEQIDLVGLHPPGDLLPLVLVARVDRGGLDPEPVGRLELVAHQGQQGRHEQGGSETFAPQEVGSEEVDGALAPARSLDEQDPLAVADEGGDRLALPRSERGEWILREAPEPVELDVVLGPAAVHAQEYAGEV